MREIQTYKEANMETDSTSLVLVLTWRFNVIEPRLQAGVELRFLHNELLYVIQQIYEFSS